MKFNAKKLVKPVSVVASVLLIIVIVFAVFIQSKLNLIGNLDDISVIPPESEFFDPDSDVFNNSLDVIDPRNVSWANDSDPFKNKDIINILLIGQDSRTGLDRGRSDTMMIVTINKKSKTVNIISLMRDMYVQIPGYSDNRLNAAYAFGGMKLLDKTIEKNFLIKIDGNVAVDFEGFKNLIDEIGGIDIEINESEAEYINKSNKTNFKAGTVHMDGKIALFYSRIRKIGHADFERTQRQRNVVTACFNKIKNLSLFEINKSIDSLLNQISTDFNNNQILDLALTLFLMKLDTIGTHRIPVDNSFKNASIRGMSVLVPDLEKNRKAILDIVTNNS